ncbi:hypothetical protein BD560DRAFT_59329 [Blakeslea trispora]|nr:hypothetical protein BD560DRAFT_59329 [Blakeslea trispora]
MGGWKVTGFGSLWGFIGAFPFPSYGCVGISNSMRLVCSILEPASAEAVEGCWIAGIFLGRSEPSATSGSEGCFLLAEVVLGSY